MAQLHTIILTAMRAEVYRWRNPIMNSWFSSMNTSRIQFAEIPKMISVFLRISGERNCYRWRNSIMKEICLDMLGLTQSWGKKNVWTDLLGFYLRRRLMYCTVYLLYVFFLRWRYHITISVMIVFHAIYCTSSYHKVNMDGAIEWICAIHW